MSYITEISPASLARSTMSSDQAADPALALSVPEASSIRLAAGLEVAILLAMLSGLSLAFCTIAAGAFG